MGFRVIALRRKRDAEAFDRHRQTVPVEVDAAAVDREVARLRHDPAMASVLADDAWTKLDEDEEVMQRPPEPPEIGLLRFELQRTKGQLVATQRQLALEDSFGHLALRVGRRGLPRTLVWAVRAWFYAWTHDRRARKLAALQAWADEEEKTEP